jgi:serine/threonine protein kinase
MTAIACVQETILALEYLHMQGYMYRDLKPENILISAQGHIRLSDFDLVRSIDTTARIAEGHHDQSEQTYAYSADRASSFVGTAEYVAPEVIQRRPYELATEWWSLGSLTYEMVSGFTPFVGQSTAATFRRILHARLEFRDDINLISDCKDFIQSCLQRDPATRLGKKRGAAELKGHRWMRPVQWSLLANTERPPYIPNMPFLPEAAEGAAAVESSVVVDRYRLFGHHFHRRGSESDQGCGDGACAVDDAHGARDAPEDDPFSGFDWVPN